MTAEFGNGFSYANLKNMRQFYKTYSDEIGYTLSSQLPWSHNRLIMRVADWKAREWYLREAAREQWSVRQLERNINSFYYQRQIEKEGNNEKCGVNKNQTAPSVFRKLTASNKRYPYPLFYYTGIKHLKHFLCLHVPAVGRQYGRQVQTIRQLRLT